MENKKLLYSSTFLTLSLIIFSVIIPLIQTKIDYWKEQRNIYGNNLLNTEFQRIIGIQAADLYEVIGIVRNSSIIIDPKMEITLGRIQQLYLNRAEEATANTLFLATEPVNDDQKPNRQRYEEIKAKIKGKSPLLMKEADTFLSNFNQTYQRGINLWSKWKNIAYIVAIIFNVLGVWIGIRTKENPNENLIKEIRGLIPQINKLMKKIK